MKRLPWFLAACLLGASPALVRADVINFSGLSTDDFGNPPEARIPNGYDGFNWPQGPRSGFSSLNTQNDPNATPSGYSNANTDSNSASVAFNLFGHPASITRATPFSFYGAFFTAAWKDNLYIDVKGYRNGHLLYDNTFTVDSTGPTFEAFKDVGIDTLNFQSFSGVGTKVHGWVPGKPQSHPPHNQFAMDDLVFTAAGAGQGVGALVEGGPAEPNSAPEPAGLVLFAVGGAAVGVVAWRRRRLLAG